MDDAERQLPSSSDWTRAQRGPERNAKADSKPRSRSPDLFPEDDPDDPPEAAESGLVQQQRWFALIRRKLQERR